MSSVFKRVKAIFGNMAFSLVRKKRFCSVRKEIKDKRRKAIYSKNTLSKEQKKQIDTLYKKNYGHKVPYTWHRYYMCYTGNFNPNYFPELLYIPLFENLMNVNEEYAKVLSDKNFLSQLDPLGTKMPKTIVSIVKGAIRNNQNRFITQQEAIDILFNVGKVFIKPAVDSCSGRGCFLAEFVNGKDIISQKSVEDVFNSLGKDYVVQECIECHESISKIYGSSVNTFRVITYRWKQEIRSMPVIMRIGQGGANVDNAHAGGMFIAIDDDGTMHKTAFTEFNKQYTVHPDSNITFEGYKIDLFPNVLASAKKMHESIPQLGSINWDLTIDKNGKVVLIEANTLFGSIWMTQMAHGCGAFGDKTEEVLQWLRIVKKVPLSKLQDYCFGNIPANKF